MPGRRPSTLTFCEDVVDAAGDIVGVAYWFVFAALILGIAYAVAELIKRFLEPPSDAAGKLSQSSLKELLDALKALIQALASAPAWIALAAIGLVLFWAPSMTVPEKCVEEMNQPYASAESDGAEPAEPAANTARSGDGVTSPGEDLSDR